MHQQFPVFLQPMKWGCVTIDHINTAANSDPHYQDLLKIIKSGFPTKRNQTEASHLREF